MALVLQDRVSVNSTGSGTGNIVLGSAYPGYRTFASCIPDGSIVYYTIANQAVGSDTEWEVGYGKYVLSTDTLVRNNGNSAETGIFSSSNAGAYVNFTAGTNGLQVFIAQPAEKAIYEEVNGETLIDGGPITVVGAGVTSIPNLPAELGKFIGNVDSFAQIYNINQNDGTGASADFVAYNDLTTDGNSNFVDMGINSSNYSSVDYPIFTPGSAYVFNDGGTLFVGSQTNDVSIFAGGATTSDIAATANATTKNMSFANNISVTANVSANNANFTTAAYASSNVALITSANQLVTKQYVDETASTGIHIHEPVLVETTANLAGTYAQGGTTFNITDITTANTVTTSVTHSLALNDQIWLTSTAGNGLSANTAYFVYSIPAANQLTLSLTFGGAQITSLTNATGLTYPVRANSGVGATLTNSGANVALAVDGVNLATTNRVMVRLQTNPAENGVYVVTTVGAPDSPGPGAAWVLTRSTDANQVNPSNPDGLGTGDYFYTTAGLINAGDSHVLTTEPNTMIIGYTGLTYTQFSGAVTYTGTAPINVSGQTIALTGIVDETNGGTGTGTVTTGDVLYGSGTNTWGKLALGSAYKSLSVNASGTQVEWNAVALNQSAAVSGALGATNGGTGQATYTLGDIIYSSATNTLAKLAGQTTTTKKFLSQTGNGTISAAPVWDTIPSTSITGLGTMSTQNANAVAITGGSITGITDLAIADGGTGASTAATAISNLGGVPLAGGVSMTGALYTRGAFGMKGNVAGNPTMYDVTDQAGATVMEIGRQDGVAATSAMDFHTGPTLTDYDTRLTFTGGNGTAGQGTMTISAASVVLSGGVYSGNGASLTNVVAVRATNIAGGLAGGIPYQTAVNTTSILAAGTGVLVGGATPAYTTTPTLTGTNFSGIPNAALTNSSVTVTAGTGLSGGGAIALGSSATINLANTSVTPGSYTTANITVDAQGRLTAASSGTSGTTLTNDTTTNGTYYPWLTTSTTGSVSTANVSSTKLFFNPSTGTLTSTVHTSNSDERLKENWTDVAPDFLAKLAQVKHGVFSRIDSGNREPGVTAQSLQGVLPEAVVEGADGYLSVNYGGAALLAAIELAKVVEELRAEVKELKAKLTNGA